MASGDFAVNLHTKPCTMHPLVICLFLNLFVCLPYHLPAQPVKDTVTLSKTAYLLNKKNGINHSFSKKAFVDNNLPLLSKPASLLLRPLPANFYSDNLGFFCSHELQIEKITKIPFRFRLGSAAYTDFMEGKNTGR